MDYVLTHEVGVMVKALEAVGFEVIVASEHGQTITGKNESLKVNLKLADVKPADYAGFILPSMASPENHGPAGADRIVAEAVALGKPLAAQNSGLFALSESGVLKGKQYAAIGYRPDMFPTATYMGKGVVQDGNIITSGICPLAAEVFGGTDGTATLIQKLIDTLASVR
jgi:putative intracellular protease/amidase